jgi:phosphoribosyl 1,2-cyclic phosphodiesterase
MMLKVINSGSDSNGYMLDNGDEALLIEAGCDMKSLKIGLDWNIQKVVGCVVSHSHLD